LIIRFLLALIALLIALLALFSHHVSPCACACACAFALAFAWHPVQVVVASAPSSEIDFVNYDEGNDDRYQAETEDIPDIIAYRRATRAS
jgi:hypothetical protein